MTDFAAPRKEKTLPIYGVSIFQFSTCVCYLYTTHSVSLYKNEKMNFENITIK